MSQVSSSKAFARPCVSVTVDDTPPPAMPSPGRLIDTLTPKTRRVSKLPHAEVAVQNNIIRCRGIIRQSYPHSLRAPSDVLR